MSHDFFHLQWMKSYLAGFVPESLREQLITHYTIIYMPFIATAWYNRILSCCRPDAIINSASTQPRFYRKYM